MSIDFLERFDTKSVDLETLGYVLLDAYEPIYTQDEENRGCTCIEKSLYHIKERFFLLRMELDLTAIGEMDFVDLIECFQQTEKTVTVQKVIKDFTDKDNKTLLRVEEEFE